MVVRKLISPIIAVVILISLSVIGVFSIKLLSSLFQKNLEKEMNVLSFSGAYDILNGFVDEDNIIYLLVYFPEEVDLKKEKLELILRGDKSGKILRTCITANEKVAEKEKCYLCLNCKKPIKGRYMLKLDDYFIECDLHSVFNVTKEMIEFISPRYITKGVVKLALYPLDFTPIIRREIFFDWWNITDEGIDFSSVPWMIKYAMYRVWYKVNITGPTNDITVYFRIPDEILEKITEYCAYINDSYCWTGKQFRVFEYNVSNYSQELIDWYGRISYGSNYTKNGITIYKDFTVHFQSISKGVHYFVVYFPFHFYDDMENHNAIKLRNVGDGSDIFYVEDSSITGDAYCEFKEGTSIGKYGNYGMHIYVKAYSYGYGSGSSILGVCYNLSNIKISGSFLEYKVKYSTSGYSSWKTEFGIVIVLNTSEGKKSVIICHNNDCSNIKNQVNSKWAVLTGGIKLNSLSKDNIYRKIYNLEEILGKVDGSIEKICVYGYAYKNGRNTPTAYGEINIYIDDLKIVNQESLNFFK